MQDEKEGENMNASELTEKVLKSPMVYPSGIFTGDCDNRPVIEHILEGLAHNASTGNPAAARELREWLALKVEINA